MFAIEITPGDCLDYEGIDTAPTFDAALSRYAEIAWEDPPHVLLGRTVIIRCTATGDVWAVGSYRPSPKGWGLPAVLTFCWRRSFTAVIVSFMRASDGRTLRRDHEVADDLLLPD